MTKRKPHKPNVSQLIRDRLEACRQANDPDEATPAAIVRWLRDEQGLDVAAQYVSTIKSNAKKQGPANGISAEFAPLQDARRFCQAVGGRDKARQILDDYLNLTADTSPE